MKNIIINDRIHCIASFCDKQKQIVIYCHGFGENKECAMSHFKILNDNYIGIISFDMPCHGEDKQIIKILVIH